MENVASCQRTGEQRLPRTPLLSYHQPSLCPTKNMLITTPRPGARCGSLLCWCGISPGTQQQLLCVGDGVLAFSSWNVRLWLHIIAISMGNWWRLSLPLYTREGPQLSTDFSTWDDFSWRFEEKKVIRFPSFEDRPLTSVDKIMCKTMFGKTSRGLVSALQRNPPHLNPDGKIR